MRNLLAELAEKIDVRVLLWQGAPVPAFRPSRGDVRRARENLVRHTRIRSAVDGCTGLTHCHHEKTIVIDDRVAFVGGIDLTLDGGRSVRHRDAIPRARRDRVARRRRADRGAGGRRRRGALPAPLARRAARGDPAARPPSPSLQAARAPGHAHVAREDVSCGAARRLLDPRVVHGRASLRRAARLPREPVPLVARDRRGADRQAARSAERRLPGGRAAPCAGERRRRRLARPDRRAHPRRRRRRALPRLHRLRAEQGSSATSSTSTRRSGSSTTGGSRSARPT